MDLGGGKGGKGGKGTWQRDLIGCEKMGNLMAEVKIRKH